MRKITVKAYTLIELLVVIAIIGVLTALSFFAINNSRLAGRDAKRKADLESLRTGLELYRADCGRYPAASSNKVPLPLTGDGSKCPVDNVYISDTTYTDPVSSRYYRYAIGTGGVSYELCAYLEQGSGSVTCGASPVCGSSITCNYKVINP